MSILAISGKLGSGKDTVASMIQYLTLRKKQLPNGYNSEKDIVSFNDFNININYNLSEWKIKRFADGVKDITCILLGCTREQLENREYKEAELGEEWWYWYDKILNKIASSYLDNTFIIENHQWTLIKPTPRLFMQLIGTEFGRNIIHPNTWVNALMSEYKPVHYGENLDPFASNEENMKHVTNIKYANWIIPDMRFENELEAVKQRGGITIRVNRNTIIEKSLSNISDNIHPSETALDNAEFDYVIDNNGTIEDLLNQVKTIMQKEKLL